MCKISKLRRVAEDFGVLRVIHVQTIEDFGVLRVMNVQHIEDLGVLHVLQPPLRAKMSVMVVSAHHHTQLRAQVPHNRIPTAHCACGARNTLPHHLHCLGYSVFTFVLYGHRRNARSHKQNTRPRAEGVVS